MDRCVYQPLFFEYGENRENTSRTVHVLYVIVRIGCYFTKHRRLAGQGVYVLYRKVYSGLLGYGEQVPPGAPFPANATLVFEVELLGVK